MGESTRRIIQKFKTKFFRVQTAEFISEFTFISGTYVLMFIDIKQWYKILLFAVFFLLYYLTRLFCREIRAEKPKTGKRYTKKSDDGAVYIFLKDYHQAILRLSEFEDWLER